MKRMSDVRIADRPREKIVAKGVASLSDFELLQALIGSGNKQADVGKIAKNTLKLLKTHGADITYDQLQQVTGLGPARITQILASLELAHRYLIDSDQPVIDSPEAAVEQLDFMRNKQQEYFVVMTLDGANRLIAKRTITIGTLTSSLVHPREVFADAITDCAASIIVAHNHPSGILTASQSDIDITNRLKNAGEIVGIDVIDHLIITSKEHISILEHAVD